MRATAILLNLTSLLILSGCPSGGLTIYSHQVDGLYLKPDVEKTPAPDYITHIDAAGKYGCLSWEDIQAVIERLNSCENIGVGL